MQLHSYKQISDLTLEDLDEYPVWELLLEDDIHAKDECTVKGYKKAWSDMTANVIVKAKFELNDGTIHYGFVKPDKSFAISQPVIILENNHIGFWYGIMKPTIKEKENLYRRLVRKPENVFPIKWTCGGELGNIHNGVINGFGYYNSVEDSFNDIEQTMT
jgi:hypothetical protein